MTPFEKLVYDSVFTGVKTFALIWLARNSLDEYIRPIVGFAIMFILQTSRNAVFGGGNFLTMLPMFAIDAAVICFCFRGRLSKKLFVIMVFYALSVIFDASAALIFLYVRGLFFQSVIPLEEIAFPTTILSKALLLSVVVLLKKTFRNMQHLLEWLKYLPAPVVTVVALMYGSPFTNDVADANTSGLLVIICVLCLLSTIYIIVIMQRTSDKAWLQYKLKLLEENKRQSGAHFQELKAAYKQVERAAHDMKHHLDYLESAPDLESVVGYIRSIKGNGTSILGKFTGNLDIDTILNAKSLEMQEKGIALQVNGILPLSIDWLEAIDVVIILGNALSNAIEACERCGGKKIIASFIIEDSSFTISVENPANGLPIRKNTDFGLVSSKEEPGHGIGMESMKSSVDAYDGFIKYEVTNGVFRLDILLQSLKIDK